MTTRTNITQRSRRLRSQAGSALIEFAMFAPFLILLWMGIVETGRYAAYAILAQASARSGANYGAWNLMTAADLTNIDSWATGDAQYLPTPITVTYNHLCSVNGALPPTACTFSKTGPPVNTVYYIKVTVSASYSPWITFKGFNKVTVNGSDTMRVSQQ